MFDENIFNKYLAIRCYLQSNKEPMNDLIKQYPEFEKIDLFIKIAEEAYTHFKETKYCTFNVEEDDFFSLIDCTFKGYDDELYIMSENPDICDFPMLMFDHSCMLYIYMFLKIFMKTQKSTKMNSLKMRSMLYMRIMLQC